MIIHKLKKEEVFEHLHSSQDGLSETEAQKRLKEYGENIIKEVAKENKILKFLKHFTHIFAILLWVAAILCFYSEYKHPGEGLLNLGIAIVIVIIINGIFSYIQETKAEKALEELKKLLPFKVKVMRDGKINEISVNQVVPGDLIILEEGDKVPADSRVIEAKNFFVNNALLTGESEPQKRTDEPYVGEYLDSQNIVFAGTLVVGGKGKALVFATGMSTEFGKIAHITTGIKGKTSKLQMEIKDITKFVGIFASVTGIIFFVSGHIIGRSFWENFLFAIGIIIANVPEGLLPTVTLSLAMSVQRMAKKKALVKSLSSVETLGAVTVICTDKTGTLTQNKMRAREIFTYNSKDEEMLYLIAKYCNNAYIDSDNNIHGDPTEKALYEFSMDKTKEEGKRISEIPFDSVKKRMSVIYEIDNKKFVFTKGAFETTLPICKYIREDNKIIPLNEEIISNLKTHYEHLTMMGLRVLTFAYKDFRENENIEDELIFAGFIGLEDPPHPEVPEAIKKCKKAGIRIIMITGDAENTAKAIAKQVGINTDKTLNSSDVQHMSDNELKDFLKKDDIVFYRMTPSDKLRVVTLLKDLDEIVAVTGDGVNDAPALKKADCGIAMGISGTDVAKEVADIILLDDNFATIVSAIEEGRAVFENIRNFITYIFSSNIPEIIPYIVYVLTNIPLPLTIMQILAIDLGTDILPALSLGTEKPAKEIMEKPPRSEQEKLLDLKTLLRAYCFLGPFEAVAGFFGYFYIMTNGFETLQLSTNPTVYIQATSAFFVAIVITQIANVFVCRNSQKSIFSLGFTTNRMILLAIIVELLLSIFIIYTHMGNKFFQTHPLPLNVWLYLIPFAFLLLIADEIRKYISHRIFK